MAAIDKSTIEKIITDPLSAKLLVETADSLGQELKNMYLATNQIRSLFGEVRQIEAEWGMGSDGRARALRRFILMKPKMAYRARRERGQAVQTLVSVLDPALNAVIQETDPGKQDEHFGRFVDFFEAILAYHKAYGGS
jgi:CRISPR-associated protein Csm2